MDKIIIQPTKVRGYGDIVDPKLGSDFDEYNCSLEVSEDTVNGEDTKVFVMTPETTVISLVLSSNVSTCTVGGTVNLSVTVTEDGSPITSQSVSFKLGNTELGTATTNSSGVATYTYTAASSGSLNFTATYGGKTSNTVNVVCSKKTTTATLSASSSSINIGSNVTLTGTIKYNNTGVSGLSVTFKEGTTTVGTGTTDSSGQATCTVSNLSLGDHTFTVTSTETETYTSSTSTSVTVTVNKKSTSTSLSLGSSTIYVGGSTTATATVTSGGTGVNGLTVTFKDGNTTLGTGTTNSSGVATYTLSGLSVGSHSITAAVGATDTYDGSTSSASTLTVSKHSNVVSLSASPTTAMLGDTVTLTATVKDENNNARSGVSVTFKDGTSTLTTASTNSSGVATASTSSLSQGSHSLTAVVSGDSSYNDGSSSAVTVTVSTHNYSIAFSQSSYTAVGGSATLEITLLDNSAPVVGAVISVSGTDSSSYSGLTNSSGVASVTVNNISSETSFICVYSNVSDTCTVTVPSYLFYDDCSSSSRLSEYGSAVQLFNTTGAVSLSYNSTENAYSLTKTSNADKFGGYKIPITTLDGIRVTFKAKVQSTSAYSQFGIGIQQSTSKFEMIRIRGDKYLDGFKNSTNTGIISQSNVAAFSGDYYTVTIDYDGSNRTIKIYNSSDSLIKTWTGTIQTYTNASMYIACNTNSNGAYIKEIKVEPL